MIEFAFPMEQLPWWALLGIALLAALWAVLRLLERRRQRRLARLADARLVPRLVAGHDPRLRRPLMWLPLLGFLCLGLAFAGPRWGRSWQNIEKHSRDIVVCLDTSESMRADDTAPNRLDRAKLEVAALLDKMPGDRFALVVFSGAAVLQCPLTVDHGYFRHVLDAVDTDSISREGTDIAAALRAAQAVFDEETASEATRDYRAVLLITDGEAVSGDAIEAADALGKTARVCVVGVGDPDGALVQPPATYGRSGATQPHLSKLDEKTLARVATQGNGLYTRSRADSWDIEQIFERLDLLSSRIAGSEVRYRLINRYQWPLAVAVACFFAEGLWIVMMPWLRRRRERRALREEAYENA